eukprot:CAMPEP_0116825056 /NCGR_PEP_ID=MMETSP0418-20121206/1747_1 /TAXON_ID=1158023 /ORGANISM="Astrosyne radiata, Strain 13vi08-1A" /LENGTH=161 /DNA_ID=CAMNT_0004453509 /DNA_START=1095 /DNA_END=1577 /DNA_ORIENTATION=-
MARGLVCDSADGGRVLDTVSLRSERDCCWHGQVVSVCIGRLSCLGQESRRYCVSELNQSKSGTGKMLSVGCFIVFQTTHVPAPTFPLDMNEYVFVSYSDSQSHFFNHAFLFLIMMMTTNVCQHSSSTKGGCQNNLSGVALADHSPTPAPANWSMSPEPENR